jgi:hypothetical protein
MRSPRAGADLSTCGANVSALMVVWKTIFTPRDAVQSKAATLLEQ